MTRLRFVAIGGPVLKQPQGLEVLLHVLRLSKLFDRAIQKGSHDVRFLSEQPGVCECEHEIHLRLREPVGLFDEVVVAGHPTV